MAAVAGNLHKDNAVLPGQFQQLQMRMGAVPIKNYHLWPLLPNSLEKNLIEPEFNDALEIRILIYI